MHLITIGVCRQNRHYSSPKYGRPLLRQPQYLAHQQAYLFQYHYMPNDQQRVLQLHVGQTIVEHLPIQAQQGKCQWDSTRLQEQALAEIF